MSSIQFVQPSDPILNPTILVQSFEWREPMTTVTDLLIALVCFIGFLKFTKYKGEKSNGFTFFKFYFLSYGIGMVCAGWLGHGLQAYVGPEYKSIAWACSTTGTFFLALGSLQQVTNLINVRYVKVLTILFTIHYIVFLILVLAPAFSAFTNVQLGSATALIGFILPMHVYSYHKTKATGSLIISCAILYGVLPGLVFSQQISLHPWFNYNDISHVLIAAFMILMFLGMSRLAMLSPRN